ncbi:MAG: hypothetical protein J6N21_02570, partial [Butyrivibrio sp.]|nr:hypothetical protein [Butyrivibrio sp.]
MSSLKRVEQETIINFNAGEQEAIVYTSDKDTMRKLDALVTEFPEVYKCLKVNDIDKTYSMPKQYVSYRKPRKISEELKLQRRDQITKL